MRRQFITSICIFLVRVINAQQPVHEIYGINEGLASHTVYCATQDKDGFLWFGTDAGVSRFDGIEFRNFTIDDGLCDNEVLRINQDSRGRIWFLSLSGCLAYFHDGKIHSSSNDPSLVANINNLGMSNMLEDSNGHLWFSGIGSEVGLYDNLKMQVVRTDTTVEMANRGRTFVIEEGSGQIFFIRPERVFKWRNGQSVATNEIEKITTIQNCFVQSKTGVMYALDNDGLKRLINGRWEIFLSNANFSDIPNAQSLCGSDNHNFWSSQMSGGVEHVQINAAGKVSSEMMFTSEWVNFVFADRDNNEWYCTRDKGVFCITREKKYHQFYDLGEKCKVTCIESAADGNIFFATAIGDIFMIPNIAGSALEKILDSDTGTPISTLLVDDNFIHYTCFTGTYRISRKTKFHPVALGTRYNLITPKEIAISESGIIYFATLQGIKFVNLKNAAAPVETISDIPPSRTYSLCATDDGKLWFENHDQLFYHDENGLKEVVDFNEKSSGRISTIRENATGEIVVATRGSGLFFLKDGKVISALSKQDGMASNECEALRIFGNRHYVITSGGLSTYTFENGKISSVYNFTNADGIPAVKIFDVYADEENLFLATHLGLYKIPALSNRAESLPPVVQVLNIVGNDTSFTPFQRFEIMHSQNLKIDFTAITFDLPREVKFEYMLDDKSEWTTTSNRSIEFNALSPGAHVFKIRARKYNSPWSPLSEIQFSVLPPYWASWWFRLLAVIALVVITYMLIRYLTRRKYRRQLAVLEQEQALLKERNRISTDLHDDLGAELSNIVILSRIAKSKLKLKGEDAEPISKIDRAANDIINKMSGIIWSLNPANDRLDNLVDFVRKYALDFIELHNMDGDVEVNGNPSRKEVKGMVRRNAFLIVKEALHNVHKHSAATRVDVHILVNDREMKIEVEDNGRGFDPAQSGTSGLGMNSMKKRAADVNGKIGFSSNAGLGTRLELWIGI